MAQRLNRSARMLDVDGSFPLREFCEGFISERDPSEDYGRQLRTAASTLATFLGGPPTLVDLNAETVAAYLDWLDDRGKSGSTIRNRRKALVRLANHAASLELIEPVKFPTPEFLRKLHRVRAVEPWTPEEFSRLLIAARTLPGLPAEPDHELFQPAVCRILYNGTSGIDPRCWWPALLLLLVDCRLTATEALTIPRKGYDVPRGRLPFGLFVEQLHPLTTETLAAVDAENGNGRLLPWALDVRSNAYPQLYRAYRALLERAGLPRGTGDLFDRLRTTGEADGGILDKVDLSLPFEPCEAKPRKQTVRQRASKPAAEPQPGTLREFFHTMYRPRRLANCRPSTVESYDRALNTFASFLKREPTPDDLQDDRLEEMSVWICELPRSPATVNCILRHLLAIWRYAWKKGTVETLPRDVEMLKVEKRIPAAWSTDELSRLLKAAAETPGTIGGFPAADFWPALLLTLFDTGLRLKAALSARVADLDRSTGWLRIQPEMQKQRAEQAFRLHADTLASIARLQPDGRELIFPWPYRRSGGRQGIWKRLGRILERAGLPADKRNKFHMIRRTHATYLADVAGEQAAQQSLGHASIQTTRGYIDPTKLTQRVNAADAMPRPAWKQPADDAA